MLGGGGGLVNDFTSDTCGGGSMDEESCDTCEGEGEDEKKEGWWPTQVDREEK